MRMSVEALRMAAKDILVGIGESEENAGIVSEVMVSSDVRGISTHGVNLLRMIAKRASAGMLSLPTRTSLALDEGAVAVYDGHDGLGQASASVAMSAAIAKAKNFGIGMALLRHTNNVGSLGYYAYKAALEGFASIMMTNGNPSMAPYGGKEPFLGTNPIAIAVPAGIEDPLLLDMSSSVVARGKIRLAAFKGESIPDNWALDADGKPTTDPASAIDGCLLPVGGPKGSGLAIMVDIFAGMLSGSSYGRGLRSFHELDGPTGVGACCIAIDIGRFMEPGRFYALVREYADEIKTCAPLEGFAEILLPGEIEFRRQHASDREGVEIPQQVAEALDSIILANGGAPRFLTAVKEER